MNELICPHCGMTFNADQVAGLPDCPVCGRPFGVAPEAFALSGAERATRFRNPQNGYEEDIGQAWAWTLLLGPIYLAHKGLWAHAVICLVLCFPTGGLILLPYAAFAKRIFRSHYLRKGWQFVI